MQLIKQLTPEEKDQYTRQVTTIRPSEKTKEASLLYFLEYKASVTNIPSDKLSTAFRCAFFIAQKCQVTYNMKGQKMRGIGLSLNQFLRSSQPDDIIILLKDYLKRVRITDPHAQKDLNKAIRRISFLITFHRKFEKTLHKFQLKCLTSQSIGYSQILTSFAWLLFIDSKQCILKDSLQLIENTCLLAYVIAFILIYSWDYIRPAFCLDKKFNDKREISLFIQEKVLETFLIRNVETYKIIADSFEGYFESKVDSAVVKMTQKKTDFMAPEFINGNYKKMDYQYQKSLTPQDIDERIFLKQRAANLTPSKFTPFSRQGNINRVNPNHQKINRDIFSCNKAIEFDERIDTSPTPEPVATVKQVKLPKSVLHSPSLSKPPQMMTPFTFGMEMYNYISDKSRKVKQCNYPTRESDLLMRRLIQLILDKHQNNDKNRQTKANLIFCLYKDASEQYRQQNNHQSEDMMKALLALSAELVFVVSNITMSFEEIESVVNTQALNQWGACDFFLKFDKSMPSKLRLHLLDVQTKIISCKIWADYSFIKQIHSVACGGHSTAIIDKCFKRILHQIAFQIIQLCGVLKIEDRISENIFNTVKYILSKYTEQFANRHIDLFVICSIFLNCNKVYKMDLKFNEIKNKYIELNQNNISMHSEIFRRCYINDEQSVDIIKFYNSVFIHIENLRQIFSNNKQNIGLQLQGAVILKTTLRTIIPKHLSFNSIQQNKGGKTPQTNLLYAYTESPMIQGQLNAIKTENLNSRKVINFDEQEKILRKKCSEIIEVEKGEVNEYFSKKCALPNNILRNTPVMRK